MRFHPRRGKRKFIASLSWKRRSLWLGEAVLSLGDRHRWKPLVVAGSLRRRQIGIDLARIRLKNYSGRRKVVQRSGSKRCSGSEECCPWIVLEGSPPFLKKRS